MTDKEIFAEMKKVIFDALESTKEFSMIIDNEFNVLATNKRNGNIVRSGTNFTGKKCYEYFDNLDQQCHDCPINKIKRTGAEHSMIIQTLVGNKTFFRKTTPIRGKNKELFIYWEIFKEI